MALEQINGIEWIRSIKAGCIKLEHNRDKVDLLNVFPVPDGDTGTNMYLTILSAVKEGEKNKSEDIGKVAKAMSMGSLMGARGNSGVIMSQIFRGMAKVLEGKKQAYSMDIAQALKMGSETAYKAVMKPVEGTILTVIRETAKACEEEAAKNSDIIACLFVAIEKGYETLEKTPRMLSVLREAGVVDAGGQGLLYFLEGLVEGLAGEKEIELETYREVAAPSFRKASGEEISLEFQYCTELLIKGENLDIEDIKDHLEPLGDSMLVVGDEEMVKVHIHSNHPGKVLETCLQWGQLSDIKINNMLEEAHEHLHNWEESNYGEKKFSKKIGLVAVGAGVGIVDILQNLGVDKVVEGGQTMNPSTEDILNACDEVDAESVIILPNNSNVILSAEQAAEICGKEVRVVPTKSVMQAVTALIAYDPEGDIEEMVQNMREEMEQVRWGEITYAVRDSAVNGLKIKEGDVIGILEGEIVLTAVDDKEALIELLAKMANEDSELITLFYGDDITEERANQIKEEIIDLYPDCDIEVHYGGQPHYSYYVSVE
ncbi:DAK2 domain-containing protein [Thermosyntropha sp.]|uniref:DAK2 domain-containing protein n=1 Tax=Thermosyntropha sp. TaxID=2740820 RepID=UPI0025FEB461|nr:DAK2 domain-containing protein [Thermosyntropha sp.]MBO8159455.1 DAK2 domain-containing protein [Thermosyntropha sp.]